MNRWLKVGLLSVSLALALTILAAKVAHYYPVCRFFLVPGILFADRYVKHSDSATMVFWMFVVNTLFYSLAFELILWLLRTRAKSV